MVFLLIWLMLIAQGEKSKKNDIILSILSLIIGISTGNHVMIILITPAVLFSYISAYKDGEKVWKLLKYTGLIIAAVVSVYAILPLRARHFPSINWGNPQTLDGFVWLISGKLYHGLAFSVPLGDILQRIGFYAKFLLEQFGVLGLFIGILGAVKTASTPGKMKWIYFWIFFMYSIFSIGYQTNDSIVYLIPALIVYSIWVGIGIQDLWINFIGNPILGKAVICLFFLILVFRIPDIFDKIDPRKDNTARLFVNHCFDTLPQNAIVLDLVSVQIFESLLKV